MPSPATLNIGSTIIAYGDSTVNSNPKRRFVDWTRIQQGWTVYNPKSEQFSIDPGSSLNIFNGVRTVNADGTTQWTVTASPLDPTRFRFTWTGVGTAPALRTDRGLTLNTITVTVTVLANGSATFTLGSGTWGSTVAGDVLFIPGVTTGDSSGPFSALNEGYWSVLSVSGLVLTAVRPAGTIFQGSSEIKTVTANSQIQAFTSAGVQLSDKVELSAGFSASSLRTYQVVTVNPKYFEVTSTLPLALDSAVVPGVNGLTFYKFNKQYIRVEADQECAIQANGDSGQTQRVVPFIPCDPDNTGWYEKWGPMWSLTIVNRTSNTLNVIVISME
jgi:hypothetical protein